MIRGVAPLGALGLLILGSCNMLLLIWTASEILQDDIIPTAKVVWTPKLSTSAERLTSARPLGAYRQTTAHPIFFKTRLPFVQPPPPAPRPPPSVQPPPPRPAVVDPGLVLEGIIITSGEKKAYLLRKTDRSGSWVAEGEEIMGWSVQSIDAGSAILKKDDREIELPLYPKP